MAVFQKATKRAAKLRMALIGPAGSGKTYSALNIGKHLGARIAVIDTEHGSASKYADLFEFDTVEPDDFSPQTYTDLIRAAEAAGYDVLVIDSLSHAWIGKGGALELVDRASRKGAQSGAGNRGNSFGAWRDVTPLHNELVDTILAARLHVIATMRTKMAYEQEQRPDPRTGQMRTVVAKLGLQPIQREGVEYEFDVVGDLNLENVLTVSKTRCPALKDASVELPGKQIADALRGWLDSGAPALPDERANVAPRVREDQSFAHAQPTERAAPQSTSAAQSERALQPERATQPARVAAPMTSQIPRVANEDRATSTLAAAPRTTATTPTPVPSASQPSPTATMPERGAEANRAARAVSPDAVTHSAAAPVNASNPRLAPHIIAAPAQSGATTTNQTTDANHHLREEIRAKLPLAQKTERGLQGYLAQKYAADNLNALNAAQLREVLQLLNTKIAEK